MTARRLNDEAVSFWGDTQYTQIGDSPGSAFSAPDAILGLGAAVAAVSAGSTFTCAQITSGGITCWRNNDHGQLGNGPSGDGGPLNSPTPVDVIGLP